MGPRPDDAMPVARVTVITTVFNEGSAALDMLDSVLTGDVVPTEIVIADGGSTDGTVELLQQYAAAHPEVRVLTGAGGRSEGRNAPLERLVTTTSCPSTMDAWPRRHGWGGSASRC